MHNHKDGRTRSTRYAFVVSNVSKDSSQECLPEVTSAYLSFPNKGSTVSSLKRFLRFLPFRAV